MCATPHALLSALVSRLRSGGPDATKRELETLEGAGCAREDIIGALEREEGPAFERALDLLGVSRIA